MPKHCLETGELKQQKDAEHVDAGVARLFGKLLVISGPETIAGRLNTIGLSVWRDGLNNLLPEKTVIFGAELPTGSGRKYDNVALMLYKGEISISRQRIPVPHSMYRGLSQKAELISIFVTTAYLPHWMEESSL